MSWLLLTSASALNTGKIVKQLKEWAEAQRQ